jgi:hypothetical protein
MEAAKRAQEAKEKKRAAEDEEQVKDETEAFLKFMGSKGCYMCQAIHKISTGR